MKQRAKDVQSKSVSPRLEINHMTNIAMVSRILMSLVKSIPRKVDVKNRRKHFEEESTLSQGLLMVSSNVPKVINNRPKFYNKYVIYTKLFSTCFHFH